ncbi:MAG: L-2-keto-3-deoxyarabonate dehydratase [Paracidovorax wautersii]|uniref:L-2-keto-3-deoxyarabonate dehydratase n=1 Tax=Paracidovorax wautersii TaxID=1177982 RepID=A0A7V8FN91_9BURK|nr:MAG: L-2-keto-3-deoxyarabonate dehydratase [Paracidovorax wautersii]
MNQPASLINARSQGVFVISATPFTDEGALDLPSVDSLTDFYLAKGASGLTILGMMGEASKLTDEESLAMVRRVLARVAGRVPVVVGVSHASLDQVRRLSHTAMALGAAGVMLTPVAGLRTDDQVQGYCAAALHQLGPGVSVCLQDFPQATGVYTSVAVIGRLIDEFEQVVMFKHEDMPGLRKLSQLRAAEGSGRRRVSILAGNGGLFLPQELRRGADGAMTGFAYPEMLARVCRLHAEGRAAEAEDVYDAYLPLLRHEFQYGVGLALRKEVLRRRGAIRSAFVRKPGPVLDAADHADLQWLMDRLEARIGLLPQVPPHS